MFAAKAASEIVHPMSPAMRSANADGQLFSSPEVFAERAFNDFPHDKHIAPQGGWGAECADLIAPLEQSAPAWSRLSVHVPGLPIDVPFDNHQSRASNDAPVIARAFYANDSELWNKVCRAFEDSQDLSARRANVEGQTRR